MDDYGKETSLEEILEELALHCQNVTGKKCEIEVTLPLSIVDQFSKKFFKSKINKTISCGTYFASAGTVKLTAKS